MELAAEQPISTEIKMADGVFTKSMVVRRAGTIIPQHSHAYAHISVLVRGAVRVTVGGSDIMGFATQDSVVRVTATGECFGDFTAPAGITIEAGVKHTFTTLADDTIILCVHDIGTAEGVEVLEEHQIVGT